MAKILLGRDQLAKKTLIFFFLDEPGSHCPGSSRHCPLKYLRMLIARQN